MARTGDRALSRLLQLAWLFGCIAPFMGAWTHFAGHGLPVPAGDGIAFYPIALEFAATGELRHPFYSPIEAAGGPLVWHGWAATELVGILASTFSQAGFPAVLVAEATVMWIACFVAAGCLAVIDDMALRSKAAVMLAFCAALWAAAGRPEVVVHPLLAVAATFMLRRVSTAASAPALGVVLGFIFVSQPTIAFLTSILICGALFVSRDVKQAMTSIAVVALSSIATVLTVTYLAYPHEIQDWIGGLMRHATVIGNRQSSDQVLYYYFLQPRQPFVGAWLLLGTGSLAIAVQQKIVVPRSPPMFALAIVVWIAMVWFFGVRVPATNYNVVTLVPLAAIAAGLVAWAAAGKARRAILLAMDLLGATAAAGMLWTIAVLAVSKVDGVSLAEIAAATRAFAAEGRLIAIHPSIAAAVPSLVGSPLVLVSGDFPPGAELFVAIQTGSGRLNAPTRHGLVLIQDCFRTTPISFAGFKLANTPRTYEFAVYARSGAIVGGNSIAMRCPQARRAGD